VQPVVHRDAFARDQRFRSASAASRSFVTSIVFAHIATTWSATHRVFHDERIATLAARRKRRSPRLSTAPVRCQWRSDDDVADFLGVNES